MTGTVQCWLVERDYEHEDLVKLVYATPDGERALTQQRSTKMLMEGNVTAAIDIEPDRLEAVDESDRERYVGEVDRMRDRHDPDDEV